jgi:hypothetical protein
MSSAYSIFSAASEASASDSKEQECEPSRSASETNTAAPCSGSIGPPSHASTTFTPLTQSDWVGLDESTLLAADSPASPSALPASSELRVTTATSGRRCAESLHSQDPLGSLAKTLLASSRWHSTMCFLTWKVSATPRGRLLFRLVPSMRDTDAIGSGSLLATPTRTANQLAPSMQKWKSCAALLPTPAARDWRSESCTPEYQETRNQETRNQETRNQETRNQETRGKTLPWVVQNMWPTPRASDAEKGPRTAEGAAKEVARGHGPDLPAVAGGSLNPTWVEWLMGFPEGWTVLDPSEMPSSRRSRKPSGEQS